MSSVQSPRSPKAVSSKKGSHWQRVPCVCPQVLRVCAGTDLQGPPKAPDSTPCAPASDMQASHLCVWKGCSFLSEVLSAECHRGLMS